MFISNNCCIFAVGNICANEIYAEHYWNRLVKMRGYAPIKGSFNWTTEICTFIGFDFLQKIPNITQKCLIYDRIIRIYEDVKNDMCEIIRIFAEKYFFYEIRIYSRKQQQTDGRKPTF